MDKQMIVVFLQNHHSTLENVENRLNCSKNKVLVTGDAFPLKIYILKSFERSNHLSKKQKINYNLSRTCCVVENAFGILIFRFSL